MKENLRLGFTLLIITAIAALFLGVANAATKDAIAMNSRINSEDLAALLPGSDSIKTSEVKAEGAVSEVLEAYSGDELKGYVIKVASKGFHGDIEFMVAINNEGMQTGIKILSQSETPGVGAKIELPEFQEKFKDKSTEEELKVVKTASSKENEIEGITGATISSNAVVAGINEAVNFYKSAIKGMAVEEKGAINLKALNFENGILQEIEVNDTDGVVAVNEIKVSDALVGYVIVTTGEGIHGPIKVATAISIEREAISGIQVLEDDETPGLGDLIYEPEFTDKFKDKSIDGKVEVEAISGSTVSSEGVMEAVNKAVTYFNSKIKG